MLAGERRLPGSRAVIPAIGLSPPVLLRGTCCLRPFLRRAPRPAIAHGPDDVEENGREEDPEERHAHHARKDRHAQGRRISAPAQWPRPEGRRRK